MNPILAALLEQITDVCNDTQIAEMKKAIESHHFFIEVTPTMVGQYCMGSTELNVDGVATAMPVVYATEADAQAEIDAMQMGYQEDIDAGERDEDDEYEGEVMIMQWDGGDKVIIKALDMSVIDDTNTWQFHAGL